MDTTPNLALPYILASQAQKHVTHNEAIRALDALVQISVADRDLAATPGSPAEGDRYIVATAATGAWSGHDGEIAAWQDGTWRFYAPMEGWLAWVTDENALLVFDGAVWLTAAAAAALQNVPMLGLNAVADAINRLVLAAAASLFDHAGAGHQQKINKATAADTASQLYQSNASGRAELGLVGDDDFHVKVSADGSAWYEAVVIDRDSGKIGFGTNAPTSRITASENAVAPPPAATGTLTHLVQADGVACRFFLDAFASNAQLNFRRANGTNASRSALASGNSIGRFSVFGYGATGFSSTSRGGLNIVASEDWTDTAQGTRLDLLVVANGAAAESIALSAIGNGNVRVGSDASAACKLDVDGPVRVKGYTVATVPSAAAGAGQIIYVSNETGGAVLAFSDGTNWRRVTDRAVIS
jgi:Protein of unknown function (DUF2793)